jgi:hypothetical protein
LTSFTLSPKTRGCNSSLDDALVEAMPVELELVHREAHPVA